jgi:hypothetical protein
MSMNYESDALVCDQHGTPSGVPPLCSSVIYKHVTPDGVELPALRVHVAISFGCGTAVLSLCVSVVMKTQT